MAKKHEDEPPKGAPAWTATFGDLMNLLLCFFVLLFSMSSVDAAKYEQVAASFSQTFSIFTGGGTALGNGTLIGNGVSQLNNLGDYTNSTGILPQTESQEQGQVSMSREANLESQVQEEGQKQSSEMSEKIEEALTEANLQNDVSMDVTAQYVQLTMRGSLLFDSGKAELKDEAKTVLDKVGVILERYAAGTIEIEGHTDNVPISNSQYASNDELSGARALSVFQYLMSTTNLNPANVVHSGRGEYVPVADNSTPEGRAANRRVEIKIYNAISSAGADTTTDETTAADTSSQATDTANDAQTQAGTDATAQTPSDTAQPSAQAPSVTAQTAAPQATN